MMVPLPSWLIVARHFEKFLGGIRGLGRCLRRGGIQGEDDNFEERKQG
jgi:hypothetical protein